MAVNVEIDVRGIDDVIAKLEDPEMRLAAVKTFGSRAARTGKRTAVNAIDGGLGTAKRSIVSRVFLRDGDVLVKSMMPRARAISIEDGRAPGDPPKVGSIINWKRAVGRRSDRTEGIIQEITATGTEGKRFLGQAYEQWQQSLPRWLDETIVRIRKQWARKKK